MQDPLPSLEGLSAKIRKARKTEPEESKSRAGADANLAWRLVTDMAAGLLAGGGMGYMLDRWLETSPWLFLIFLFLGAAAGIHTMYRTVTASTVEKPSQSSEDTTKS